MENLTKAQLLSLIDSIREALIYLQSNTNEQIVEDCFFSTEYLKKFMVETDIQLQNSQILDQMMDLIHEKSYYQAEKLLKKFQGFIKKEIVCKPAIVFFPYQASMWGAFDSVYRAFVEDDHFDVAVVPIPYFTEDKQGNPVFNYDCQYYEKEGIPFIQYDAYPLEHIQPEVAFVLNPYDDTNLVTSVLEPYFSGNLISHVKKLVYIPYYTQLGPPTAEAYYRIPIFKNAWRVFLTSEAVKEDHAKGGVDKNKLIAFGSPKTDMMLSLREHVILPEDWDQIINQKKVFFYNTHLLSITKHGQKSLESMIQVIQFFQGHPEFAIIWRPHPLTLDALNSMCPEAATPYLKVLELAQKLPNIILDETPNPYMAMASSDAYIGDGSSLIAEYMVLNKSIYLINPAGLICEMPPVRVRYGVFADDRLWFSSNRLPGISYYDLKTNEIGNLDGLSFVIRSKLTAFAPPCFDGKNVWFPPMQVDSLVKVNATTHEAVEITNWPKSYQCGKENSRFSNSIFDESNVWLIPSTTNMLIKVDPTTNEMQGYSNWPKGFKHGDYKFFAASNDEKYIWLAPYQANMIVRVDKETGQMTGYHNWPKEFFGGEYLFSGIICTESCIWLIPAEANMIVKLNPHTGEMVGISQWVVQYDSKKKFFISSTFDGRNIWCAPFQPGSAILKLDTETEAIDFFSKWPEGFIFTGDAPFGNVLINSGKAYFPSLLGTEEMLILDIKTNEMSVLSMPFPNELREKILNDQWETVIKEYSDDEGGKVSTKVFGLDHRLVHRNDLLDLETFTQMVNDGKDPLIKPRLKHAEALLTNIDGQNGKRIYEYIKKRCKHKI